MNITLRQWYAGQMLQSWGRAASALEHVDPSSRDNISRGCFAMADAMIAAEQTCVPLLAPEPGDQLYAQQERTIDSLREAITRLVHGEKIDIVRHGVLTVDQCLKALTNREMVVRRSLEDLIHVVEEYEARGHIVWPSKVIEVATKLRKAVNADKPAQPQ